MFLSIFQGYSDRQSWWLNGGPQEMKCEADRVGETLSNWQPGPTLALTLQMFYSCRTALTLTPSHYKLARFK